MVIESYNNWLLDTIGIVTGRYITYVENKPITKSIKFHQKVFSDFKFVGMVFFCSFYMACNSIIHYDAINDYIFKKIQVSQ